MVKQNHRQMSQPERSFWRDVFKARITFDPVDVPAEKAVQDASDFADLAVSEYRKRVTWRNP